MSDVPAGSRHPKILVLDRGQELLEQIRLAVANLRPSPEVVACERVAQIGDILTDEGPFEVLVAGPSLGTRAGLTRLQIIHDELPAMAIVLAFSRRPDTGLRDLVRTGALELLQLPVGDDEMEEALGRALDVGAKREAAVGPSLTAVPAPPEPVRDGPGDVITISSATGGCGKTFFATNLAYFLGKQTGKRACIVDLDLQFGEVSTALRLRPKYTIFDALQREDTDEADLQAHIEEYLVTHETGVHVLAAPKEPAEADRIDPPDVTRIIEAVRSRFDYVVVDTPPALTEVVLAAFDLSSRLYVMATLDLPSVRNMSVFLSTLEKLRIPTDNVRLVLNKAESDVGIDLDQVVKLFPQGFETVLPYAKEVSRSINVGMPVMASSPSSEISRRIAAGAAVLLPPDARPSTTDAGDTRRAGVMQRLLGRAATI